MINIIYIIYEFGIGGLEKCVVDLINNIDKTKFNPLICCLKRTGESEKKINNRGIEIVEMHKKTGNDFSLPFKLAKLLKNKGIHIIHSANWGTYLESIIAAKLAKTPVMIHMEQGMEIDEYNEQYTIKKKIKKITIQLFANYYIDKTISVSNEIRNRFIKRLGVNPQKIMSIPNSVDTNLFKPDKILRREKRNELGIKDNEILLGSVGRLSAIKNYSLLINAFAKVFEIKSNLKLMLVGDGQQRKELENLANRLNLNSKVVFLGESSDTIALMNAMDLFILPSLFEGLSVSILEAMSVGVPIVASRVGGNPELISTNETGLLFDSDNVDELVSMLTDLIESNKLRQKLGNNAREKVLKYYDVKQMVNSYTELYLECMNSKKL